MNRKPHILVIDPISFAGGSKTATRNILRLVSCRTAAISILSSDQQSWTQAGWRRSRLYEWQWLARREQGLLYLARHLLIALQIVLLRVRFGPVDVAVGASGPGVDLALYLVRSLLGLHIVQLVQGPVARSTTIARCLNSADEVHYLPSTAESLLEALATRAATPRLDERRFHVMQNGLPAHAWPSPCHYERAGIFWAASLLKWKGLETLLDALRHLPKDDRTPSHICYIRPRETVLPVSEAPVSMTAVHWYENPHDLDELRSRANIFVSTSEREPFGLSILEAMAAGHCVVIPRDDAHWDRVLQDGVDCIKYRANDSRDLAAKLSRLSGDLSQVRRIGERAARLARHYRAESRYAEIARSLQQAVRTETNSSAQPAGR